MIQNSEIHPLRARILAEVHARPFFPVATPRRLLHLAYVTNPEAAAAHWTAPIDLSGSCGSLGLAIDAKHIRIDIPEGVLVWESHSEFTTCTWEFAVPDHPTAEPFHPSASSFLDWARAVSSR